MILVDASVFYARIAEDDEHHLEADAFFRTREPRLTTTVVVYETHALMLRISRLPASAHAAGSSWRRSAQAWPA